MKKRIAVTAAVFLVIATAVTVWGFWLEPRSIQVVEQTVDIPNLPPALAGLRIALVTDIHAGAPYIDEAKLDRIVELVNEQKPDLILLGGDYVIQGVVGGTAMPIATIADHLSHLQAPLGTFAVIGNHDWWDDYANISHVLEQHGIAVVEDANRRLTVKGSDLWLVGISDFYEGPHDVDKALTGVPDHAAAIALTHTPDIFPTLPDRFLLTFAGHTHGGQVNLPLLGPLVVPSKYGARFAHGLVVEGSRRFFISGGIGTSILPVRFGVPPEINLLTLRPASPR